jgi:mRNA interferase MazF
VVKPGTYFPERGDLVWIDFDPQAGHEQAGRRPGLVVSPASYNTRSGLALFCPVTTRVKGYPFEVRLPEATAIAGVVLADQLRSFDWRARNVVFVERAPTPILIEVLAKLAPLVQPQN